MQCTECKALNVYILKTRMDMIMGLNPGQVLMQLFHAATMLLSYIIKKNTYARVVYFSKIYHRKSLYDPTANHFTGPFVCHVDTADRNKFLRTRF